MPDLVPVADDDRVQCALLQRWLTEAGFEVRCFGDGEACLRELERSLAAAICLDRAMPGLDGMATLPGEGGALGAGRRWNHRALAGISGRRRT